MMKPTAEARRPEPGRQPRQGEQQFLPDRIVGDRRGRAAQYATFSTTLPWIGIPFVYNNRSRALLAIEKGKTGEKSIADALAQWDTTAASEIKNKKP